MVIRQLVKNCKCLNIEIHARQFGLYSTIQSHTYVVGMYIDCNIIMCIPMYVLHIHISLINITTLLRKYILFRLILTHPHTYVLYALVDECLGYPFEIHYPDADLG